MRVLFIAYHYPPDPAVGAVRAGRVARALARAGHDVQVLSVAIPGVPADHPDEEVPQIGVRRIANSLDVRQAYLDRKRPSKESSNGVDAGAGAGWVEPARVPAWKRYVFSLLWLPDDRQGWIASVLRTAVGMIRRGVDVIYTTAPPFSTHVLGWLLKRLTRKPWVAEFRDPWVGNPWKPAFVRSRGSDAAEGWLEQRCLRSADRIVGVTASMVRDLAGRSRDPGKVVLIRNGVPAPSDRGAPNGSGHRNGAKRSILYVGTLYHRRDPRPFLQALAKLQKEDRLPAATVEFIGDCATYDGQDMRAFSRELGLADLVRFSPRVPHEECQARMRSADVLLLLAQEQPTQVPQKLYEYLATPATVLAFADSEGETAEMLRQVGRHVVLTDSQPESVAQGLLNALAQSRSGDPQNDRVLQDWSTEAQMHRLVSMVSELGS